MHSDPAREGRRRVRSCVGATKVNLGETIEIENLQTSRSESRGVASSVRWGWGGRDEAPAAAN